jgi:hypothetical protein
MKPLDLTNLPLDPAVEAMKKSTTGRSTPSEKTYDPIEDAMKCNPGLTREKALEMAEAFGF